MLRPLVIAGFLCLPGVVFCNDGYYTATGAALSHGKRHPDIRMESENIHIGLGDTRAQVDVTFVFKNYGRAQSVQMGFPEEYSENADLALENFRTWVDGVRVRARRVVRSYEPPNERTAHWVKTVHFGAGQTRRVRVSYQAWYSGDVSGRSWFTYILKTGGTWRGTIGECRITVDWTKMNRGSRPEFELRDGQGREVEWKPIGFRRRQAVLRDFSPKEDLWLSMVEGFWSFSIDGNRVSNKDFGDAYVVLGEPSDPLIRVTRLGSFFGRRIEMSPREEWQHPSVARFGGPFKIVKGILIQGMRMRPLPRGQVVRQIHIHGEHDLEYVYLKDVVEALGGTFRYHPSAERVDITFPPARREGRAQASSPTGQEPQRQVSSSR
jgi:hypothetical protein